MLEVGFYFIMQLHMDDEFQGDAYITFWASNNKVI